jgi:hypothetical protein
MEITYLNRIATHLSIPFLLKSKINPFAFGYFFLAFLIKLSRTDWYCVSLEKDNSTTPNSSNCDKGLLSVKIDTPSIIETSAFAFDVSWFCSISLNDNKLQKPIPSKKKNTFFFTLVIFNE